MPIVFGPTFVIMMDSNGLDRAIPIPAIDFDTINHCTRTYVHQRVVLDAGRGVITSVFDHPTQGTQLGASYHMPSQTFFVRSPYHKLSVGR